MTKKQSTALMDIDKPHYRYWQALYRSFYSDKLYVDVGKRWKGLSVGYLLLLMIIITAPFAMRIIYDFNYFFNQQILVPIKELPPLFIQNGLVNFDKPMPYLTRNKAGQVISIVDTTGQVTNIDRRYPDLSILVTKDKLFYRAPNPPELFFSKGSAVQNSPVTVRNFSTEMNEVFNGNEWIESSGIEKVKILSEVIIYPTIVLLFFVMYFIFFLAFALMAQFVAKLFMKFSITYLQTFRLLIVSSTPHAVILLIALAANFIFTGIGFVLIGFFAAYFSMAVLALKRESNKLVIKEARNE